MEKFKGSHQVEQGISFHRVLFRLDVGFISLNLSVKPEMGYIFHDPLKS